jgi:hypothetical protein
MLAIFATLTFVGCGIFMFDVEPKIMLSFFLTSVFGLAILIFMALIFTVVRLLIKRLFS